MRRITSKTTFRHQLSNCCVALAVCALSAPGAEETPCVGVFKQHLSQRAERVILEFNEGDVNNETNAILNVSTATTSHGEVLVIRQSQTRFAASFQSNAFSISQPKQLLPVTNSGKTYQVMTGLSCGYFEEEFWYSESSGPTLIGGADQKTITPEKINRIRAYERMARGIYDLGFPQLVKSSIVWDELRMTANCQDGRRLTAELYLDDHGCPSKLTYDVEGAERAVVSYAFSETQLAGSLPDRIEKQIISMRGSDPYQAARESWRVRVTKMEVEPAAQDRTSWLSVPFQAATIVSNNTILSKSGNVYVPQVSQEEWKSRKTATDKQRRFTAGVVVSSLILTSFCFLWLMLRSRKKQVTNINQTKK